MTFVEYVLVASWDESRGLALEAFQRQMRATDEASENILKENVYGVVDKVEVLIRIKRVPVGLESVVRTMGPNDWWYEAAHVASETESSTEQVLGTVFGDRMITLRYSQVEESGRRIESEAHYAVRFAVDVHPSESTSAHLESTESVETKSLLDGQESSGDGDQGPSIVEINSIVDVGDSPNQTTDTSESVVVGELVLDIPGARRYEIADAPDSPGEESAEVSDETVATAAPSSVRPRRSDE